MKLFLPGITLLLGCTIVFCSGCPRQESGSSPVHSDSRRDSTDNPPEEFAVSGEETSSGQSDEEEGSSSDSFPDAKQLTRLATSAVRRAGRETLKAGFVELGETLPDGSRSIVVVLQSGRRVPGRLFKDRARYKIAVDEVILHEREISVTIEQNAKEP